MMVSLLCKGMCFLIFRLIILKMIWWKEDCLSSKACKWFGRSTFLTPSSWKFEYVITIDQIINSHGGGTMDLEFTNMESTNVFPP